MNKLGISLGSSIFEFLNNNKHYILLFLALYIIYRLITNPMGFRYFGRPGIPGKPSSSSTKIRFRSRR